MLVGQARNLLSHHYSPGIIKFKDHFVDPGDAHGLCFLWWQKLLWGDWWYQRKVRVLFPPLLTLSNIFTELFFVYACVYIHVYVHTRVQVPMFLCMRDAEIRNQCWVASPITWLLTFWGKYFNEITDLTHWVVSEPWGSSGLCLPGAGITGAHFSINAWSSFVDAGDYKPQSSCVHGKHFVSWSISYWDFQQGNCPMKL